MIRFSSAEIDGPRLILLKEAALRLLYKHGVRKVTVEDICRESGVSKATFYKYFENKEDVVLYLLKELSDQSIAQYRSIMDRDIPFAQKAEQMIRLKTDYTGEFSQEFISDILKNGGSEVVRLLQEQAVVTVKMVLEDFAAAQHKGLVRRDLNLQFVVYFINHMNKLVQDPELMALYATPGELIRELINFFFYGILPRRNHENSRD